MYVRWKKRKRKDGTNMLDAVLIESYRNGSKVRHRFIKLLASLKPDIPDKDRKFGLNEYQFLETVRWRLESLNLDVPEREKIEEMALKKFQDISKCSAYNGGKDADQIGTTKTKH